MRINLLIAIFLITTGLCYGKQVKNTGKVYDPCKKWIYFQESEINWVYSDGKKINGDFYYDWQIIIFDKIGTKLESATTMTEDLTNALIETGRINLNCK